MAVPVCMIVMTIFRVAVPGYAAIGMFHPAIGQMGMIVMMLIDRQR